MSFSKRRLSNMMHWVDNGQKLWSTFDVILHSTTEILQYIWRFPLDVCSISIQLWDTIEGAFHSLFAYYVVLLQSIGTCMCTPPLWFMQYAEIVLLIPYFYHCFFLMSFVGYILYFAIPYSSGVLQFHYWSA